MASASAGAAEEDQKVAMRGSRLEDFDLLQQVGSGTFCVVRLCRFKKNGKVCVVKILKKKKICYLKQVVHVTQASRPAQKLFAWSRVPVGSPPPFSIACLLYTSPSPRDS